MTINHPLVSVIIPSYNYGGLISDTIDSVLSQNIPNIQIIVIDDGSTDNTRHVLKSYVDKVQYIYQDNCGLSAARNTGIRASSGKYIQFLDADDLLGPASLSGRIEYLDKNLDIDIAVNRNRYFTCISGNKPRYVYTSGWPLYKTNLATHLCYLNIAPPHAFLVRREVVESIGQFDPDMKVCEDYDYWARAIISGCRISYCSKGVVYYRRHAANMSLNRQRQYEYDIKVHAKLIDHAASQSEVKSEAYMACLLALLAGTLYLMSVVDTVLRDDLNAQLYSQYERVLGLIEEYGLHKRPEWDAVTYLYCLRSMYQAGHIMSQTPEFIDRYQRLTNTLGVIGGPTASIDKWRASLGHVARVNDIGWLERYRILKYSMLQ